MRECKTCDYRAKKEKEGKALLEKAKTVTARMKTL